MVSQARASLWFSSAGFTVASSPGSNRSCGVMLARPSWLMVNSWPDQDGRFLLFEFSCRGKVFRVATMYAPNRNPDRNDFFDSVSSKIDVSVPTILCGDFNCVLDRSVDWREAAQDDYSRESVRALSALLDMATATDVWHYLHPSTSSFTWSRWDGTAASRIDLIGCPYAWQSQVSSLDIHPCPLSDHCAISMVFSILEAAQPGPGVWKLNTSILDDAEYVELISTFWGRWHQAQGGYPSLVKWWDKFSMTGLL